MRGLRELEQAEKEFNDLNTVNFIINANTTFWLSYLGLSLFPHLANRLTKCALNASLEPVGNVIGKSWMQSLISPIHYVIDGASRMVSALTKPILNRIFWMGFGIFGLSASYLYWKHKSLIKRADLEVLPEGKVFETRKAKTSSIFKKMIMGSPMLFRFRTQKYFNSEPIIGFESLNHLLSAKYKQGIEKEISNIVDNIALSSVDHRDSIQTQ